MSKFMQSAVHTSNLKHADRLNSLDSLRGIAALVVVLHHCLISIPGLEEPNRLDLLRDGFSSRAGWIYLTPLRILFCGPAAVLVFFVLSGLVLSKSLIEKDHNDYAPYIIKRVTRIWPAFAVAIAISAILSLPFTDSIVPGTSKWFQMTWSESITYKLIASHILMFGNDISLDNPMWSLIHEMRISLIFPLLVIFTVRSQILGVCALAIMSLCVTKVVGLYNADAVMRTFCMTFAFLWLFSAGTIIATRLDALRGGLARQSKARILLAWILGISILSVPPYSTDSVPTLFGGVLLITSGCGAIAIVVLSTLPGKARSILLSPIPQFLGRISYSLYLLHLVVISFVVHLLGGYVPVPLLIVVGAAASIPVAYLSERWLEVPTTNLGRRLAKNFMREARRPNQEREVTRHS